MRTEALVGGRRLAVQKEKLSRAQLWAPPLTTGATSSPGRAIHPPPGLALCQRDAPALPHAGLAGLGGAAHGFPPPPWQTGLELPPSWSSVWTLRSSTPFISTNSGTVFSADVADHAAGMLVDVLRRGGLRSGLQGKLF